MHHTFSRYIVWGLLSYLIAGAGLATWVILLKLDFQKMWPSPQRKTKVQTQQQIDTAGDSSLLTTSWQTYLNERYGFEFRYPVNWQVKDVESDLSALYLEISASDIWGEILVNPTGLGFEGAELLRTETILIDGRPAEVNWSRIINPDLLQYQLFSNAIVNNSPVTIVMTYASISQEETIRGFVSTIRTAVIDISAWRTYRNEEYGFEVMYPEDWHESIRESGAILSLSKRFNESKVVAPEAVPGICQLDYYILDKKKDETLSAWARRMDIENRRLPPQRSSLMTIGSQQGLRELHCEFGCYDSVSVAVSDIKVLSMQLVCGIEAEAGTPEFEKILSTFKFIK